MKSAVAGDIQCLYKKKRDKGTCKKLHVSVLLNDLKMYLMAPIHNAVQEICYDNVTVNVLITNLWLQ